MDAPSGPGGVHSSSADELTDEVLLGQVGDGDPDALATLYERYQGVAYGMAMRITNDPALAQDALQDAFVGVWRNAVRYAPERGSVRTWLLAIVHHRAVDVIRRRRPVSELPEGDAPPAEMVVPDIWGEVSQRLDRQTVLHALTTLPDVQREAIELAYFSGLTQTEIAARTRAPLGTVKSRVRLGLLSLRATLAETGAARSAGTTERSDATAVAAPEPRR